MPREAMRVLRSGRAGSSASYFDGHFAITPFGSVWKPSGVSLPFSTTSASSLNVSGTMPVYEASTTCPDSPARGLFCTLNLYSSVFALHA